MSGSNLSANAASESGGAVAVAKGSMAEGVRIEGGSRVASNMAGADGGAVWVGETLDRVTLKQCVLEGNQANGDGECLCKHSTRLQDRGTF